MISFFSATSLRVVCCTALENWAQDDRMMVGGGAWDALDTHGEGGDRERDEDRSEKRPRDKRSHI